MYLFLRYPVGIKTQAANHVAFGFLICTPSGLVLGGAGTSLDSAEQLPTVSCSDVVVVEFSFECHLNPGTYFLTAGVSGVLGGERRFLHRVVDSCMFKVFSDEGVINTGYVNLNPIIKVHHDI